jgi:sugar/nucleoside kinase (ribokinase family)
MGYDAVVAGHICLDIIPELAHLREFEPGRLLEAGPAAFATGGAVANTGQALHHLGVPVRCVGKIGHDLFGQGIRQILSARSPELADTLLVTADEPTSYSVVLNMQNADRMFLHFPGCNASFGAADVPDELLRNVRLFHFGYPPLMARMFADDGAELETLLRRAKAAGCTTSLDMSLPDSESASGAADWGTILKRVLPYVDLFLPSVEELLYMCDRAMFEQLRGGQLTHLPSAVYRKLAERAIAGGAKVVGIKAGSRGIYVRAAAEWKDFGRAQPADPSGWIGQEVWSPCFSIEAVGTAGAGDATIAGLLMGLLRGFDIARAAEAATAVGACCCEQPDATSGLREWEETQRRIDRGWDRLDAKLNPKWVWNQGVYRWAPGDGA